MNSELPPPSPPTPLSITEETEPPPQKKHKTGEEDGEEIGSVTSSEDSMIFSDEVNDTSSPIRPQFNSKYDPDEGFSSYSGEKVDKDLWDRYYQQVHESEGFDIIDYPGQCMMTTVFPMPHYLDDPKNVDTLRDYAGKALKKYNDSKGTNYEVKDILKVNGGGCRDFIFYITFSVNTADEKIFQAKVVEDLEFRLKFPIIREKPNKGSEML